MAVTGRKFSALTGGGAGALDSLAGTELANGDIAIVMASGTIYFYELDEDSGETEAAPQVIAPNVDAGLKRWKLQAIPTSGATIPVGAIIAFNGGYYTNWTNGGFTSVLGNTVANVNAAVSSSGYRVCDGSALNLPGSPIFNGSGRYLPNLTDSRFLMGSTTAGTAAGTNSASHSHKLAASTFTSGATTLTASQMPVHSHPQNVSANPGSGGTGVRVDYASNATGASTYAQGISTGNAGGGGSHTHSITLPTTAGTGDASVVENRPQFLSCIYIMRVI